MRILIWKYWGIMNKGYDMNKRVIDLSIGVTVMMLIYILMSYGIECLSLLIDASGAAFIFTLISMLSSGILILVVMGIFILINRKAKWYNTADICTVNMISTMILIPVMLFVFPLIEIPYSLIPRREMAAGYMQVLIQIFAVAAAVICAVINLVAFIVNKNKNNG